VERSFDHIIGPLQSAIQKAERPSLVTGNLVSVSAEKRNVWQGVTSVRWIARGMEKIHEIVKKPTELLVENLRSNLHMTEESAKVAVAASALSASAEAVWSVLDFQTPFNLKMLNAALRGLGWGAIAATTLRRTEVSALDLAQAASVGCLTGVGGAAIGDFGCRVFRALDLKDLLQNRHVSGGIIFSVALANPLLGIRKSYACLIGAVATFAVTFFSQRAVKDALVFAKIKVCERLGIGDAANYYYIPDGEAEEVAAVHVNPGDGESQHARTDTPSLHPSEDEAARLTPPQDLVDHRSLFNPKRRSGSL
jgi:hypothetical protein